MLPVRPDGLLDPEALRAALEVPTLLVSVMAVNNEIGVIQDISALAAIAKEAGALFHTDAAQATGKIPLDVNEQKIDLLSISGHKIYGPKGIGALYVRRRPRVRLLPLFSGGGQERGLRSGTLATPLIVGLGEACRIAQAEMALDEFRITGPSRPAAEPAEGRHSRPADERLRDGAPPGNLNTHLPGRDGAEDHGQLPGPLRLHRLRLLLGRSGTVLCSARAGDARSEAARTLRIGVGRFTSPADIDYAAAALTRGADENASAGS